MKISINIVTVSYDRRFKIYWKSQTTCSIVTHKDIRRSRAFKKIFSFHPTRDLNSRWTFQNTVHDIFIIPFDTALIIRREG